MRGIPSRPPAPGAVVPEVTRGFPGRRRNPGNRQSASPRFCEQRRQRFPGACYRFAQCTAFLVGRRALHIRGAFPWHGAGSDHPPGGRSTPSNQQSPVGRAEAGSAGCERAGMVRCVQALMLCHNDIATQSQLQRRLGQKRRFHSERVRAESRSFGTGIVARRTRPVPR